MNRSLVPQKNTQSAAQMLIAVPNRHILPEAVGATPQAIIIHSIHVVMKNVQCVMTEHATILYQGASWVLMGLGAHALSSSHSVQRDGLNPSLKMEMVMVWRILICNQNTFLKLR